MAALFEKLDNSLPMRRKWISVNTPTTDETLCFVLVSYNILADCHVSSQTYPYLPKGYRNMTERHPQILKELLYHHDADVICLQEVNPDYFEELLAPTLSKNGYKGLQCNKSLGVDEGPAVFYKECIFDLLKYEVVHFKDQIQKELKRMSLPACQVELVLERTRKETVMMLLQLQSKRTGQILNLGNMHAFWMNHIAMDVVTLQVGLAVNALVQFANDVNSALILCGDFNTEPQMPAYELLQDGYLSNQSIQTLQRFTIAPKDDPTKCFALPDVIPSCFQHPVKSLQSAYKTVVGDEVPFSQFHDPDGLEWIKHQDMETRGESKRASHCGISNSSTANGKQIRALDYFWFSAKSLSCQGVLEMVASDVLAALYACPNTVFPSDHLLMKAKFCFKETLAK